MKIEYLRGSNVISLLPIRTKARFPAISLVEAYWEGLRNGRPMPARTEIDPRGLTDALEYAFILEKIAPGLARIRLAGAHLNDLLGMEVRGMPVTALFLPEARNEVKKALDAAFTQPATTRLDLTGDTGMTRPRLEAKMYMAPLRDEHGAPTRILGALQSVGRIGRPPRRFNTRKVEINALFSDAGASMNMPALPKKRDPREIPGFAEHATGFRPLPVAEKKVEEAKPAKPHLRLVSDNDV